MKLVQEETKPRGVEDEDDAHHTCASEVPFSEPPRRKMSVQRCTVES